jgi:hypothetical protein
LDIPKKQLSNNYPNTIQINERTMSQSQQQSTQTISCKNYLKNIPNTNILTVLKKKIEKNVKNGTQYLKMR